MKDVKLLENVQNKALRFVFRVRGKCSWTKLRKDLNICSLKDRRKDMRRKLYYKVKYSGVLSSKFKAPTRHHNTRQRDGLFVPSIKNSAYFYSFWPRATREIRDGQQTGNEI